MRTLRRSSQQILKDCEKIKKAAQMAKSMKEMEQMVNLSHSQIMTTLSYHPIIKQRVLNQILENARKVRESDIVFERDSVDKEGLWEFSDTIEVPDIPDLLGFSDDFDTSKTQKASEEVQYSEELLAVRPEFRDFEPGKKYVLDTSISCVYEINQLLELATSQGSKAVITSIVNDELEKLQKRNETDSVRAQIILKRAALDTKNVEVVWVDKVGVPDDCIVQYCVEHKEEVILLTADKHMTLDARAKGVKSIFFSHWNQTLLRTKTTLEIAQFKRGILSIDATEFKKKNQLVWVLNKEKVYERGPIQLFEGFQVFLAQKDWENINFMHVKVLQPGPKDNCEIIFIRAVTSKTVLKNESYLKFIDEARKQFND